MRTIKFNNLRMIATSSDGIYSLNLCISSGFVDFSIDIPLSVQDYEVLQIDQHRAALLQAALHHPFQMQDSALSAEQVRNHLDIILHGSEKDVEKFLTQLDQGNANGAIANMMKTTTNVNYHELRQGNWFKSYNSNKITKF